MARIKQEKEKNFTVFGEETGFDGVLSFADNLVIAGSFTGTINATGNLEFAKKSVCVVDSIKAESVVISGSVKGDIEASDRVEMCSGSRVTGNVTAVRLRIANDVDFSGEINMLQTVSDVDIFAVTAQDLKQPAQQDPQPDVLPQDSET